MNLNEISVKEMSLNRAINIQRSDATSSFVGFANLPNQVHRKIAKRGFEFTLMVVGMLNYF